MKKSIKSAAYLVYGLLTFIPGIQRVLPSRGSGGGTNSAYYCYGVWLKHFTLGWENGLCSIPNTLVELGPGKSLGVGLSAMLCGVDNYYALDVERFSNIETNLEIFDELVALFESRAAKRAKGWPDIDNYLNEKGFPSHILTDELLKESLSEKRVAAIRNTLKNPEYQSNEVSIKYMVPWPDDGAIENDSVDLILSHSVLEYVVDLESTYRALYSWLKPKGMMTHQIDFTSHNLSEKWNGFRAYPAFLWTILLGKQRLYLINRQPHSAHIDLMKKNGFSVICDLTRHRTDGIQRSDLSRYWKNIDDDDLTCSGAFIQAEKK
jgi:hypothetical protein